LPDDNLEIVFRGDSLGSLVIEGLQVVDVAIVIQGLRDAGGFPGDRDPVREACFNRLVLGLVVFLGGRLLFSRWLLRGLHVLFTYCTAEKQ